MHLLRAAAPAALALPAGLLCRPDANTQPVVYRGSPAHAHGPRRHGAGRDGRADRAHGPVRADRLRRLRGRLRDGRRRLERRHDRRDPAGSEFDGDWSPDGDWVVYRDSTRGINENDEIAVARADGSERRIITDDPANDWGPAWSPDGSTIAFNSDRDGGRLRGYLVAPDGTNLRPMGIDAWVEYASFSPDGTRIAFMGHQGSNYEIYVSDIATGAVEQLTDSPGQDGWPAWSPDGSTIAFSSVRDDCRFAAREDECWQTDSDDDEHHDIWLIDPDGSNLRRATPESGQFVAWSPDGGYLLVSGRALYVVRPDGSGRLELRAEGMDHPLGGIPDWR